jgi:hypothetical protein
MGVYLWWFFIVTDQIRTKFSLQGAFSPLFDHKTGCGGVKSPKTGLWSRDTAV